MFPKFWEFCEKWKNTVSVTDELPIYLSFILADINEFYLWRITVVVLSQRCFTITFLESKQSRTNFAYRKYFYYILFCVIIFNLLIQKCIIWNCDIYLFALFTENINKIFFVYFAVFFFLFTHMSYKWFKLTMCVYFIPYN